MIFSELTVKPLVLKSIYTIHFYPASICFLNIPKKVETHQILGEGGVGDPKHNKPLTYCHFQLKIQKWAILLNKMIQ